MGNHLVKYKYKNKEMQTKTITLMNGNKLECEVGKPFTGKTKTEIYKEEGKFLPVFENFVWLLLENADLIMKDSRMFLCPIYSQSFPSFLTIRRPRLGTFIEWWTQCSDVSCDKYGNPIYYISGRPMTGGHSCCSIDKCGNSRTPYERDFITIVKSFSSVNNKYMEVKADGEYYEFEEVLKILCGQTYEWRMTAVRYKIELEETKRDLKKYREWNRELSEKLGNVLTTNRRMIFSNLKNKIINFYMVYSQKEKDLHDAYVANKKFKQDKKALLHNGEMSPEEYKEMMEEASIPKRTIKNELSDMAISFMYENFNPNPNGISLDMVLEYAKHQINKC